MPRGVNWFALVAVGIILFLAGWFVNDMRHGDSECSVVENAYHAITITDDPFLRGYFSDWLIEACGGAKALEIVQESN